MPLRPPAVPKRSHIPSAPSTMTEQYKISIRPHQPPALPPPRTRALPPPPPATDGKPRPPVRAPASVDTTGNNNINNNNNNNNNTFAKHTSRTSPQFKQQNKHQNAFEFNLGAEFGKLPPAPAGPPPPAPKTGYKPSPPTQQYNTGKVSVRQDSSVSSDSFSQTSSPSYTTKTMETPLLPPRTPVKQNGLLIKSQPLEDDANGNATITKSASTPASLQTIVRFHNGSNMSLHHRVRVFTSSRRLWFHINCLRFR